MSTLTVTLKNVEAVRTALLELPDKVARKALKKGVAEGAQLVTDLARTIAPMYHGPIAAGHPPAGTLRRMIRKAYAYRASSLHRQCYIVGVMHGKTFQSAQRKRKGKSVTVNLDAFYWRYVEFGTVKMPAANGGRGFLRPAMQARWQSAAEKIIDSLQAQISAEAADARR